MNRAALTHRLACREDIPALTRLMDALDASGWWSVRAVPLVRMGRGLG